MEKETAAKQGRPVFLEMLKALWQGKADGLLIHKIDRGARNLKDWADIGSLIDAGIEVHFANESLDLTSRGGRLSADIQAVVAADYIRNLREEVKKGFYGRLKQGLYPMPAPIGYLDKGKGEPKSVDPVQAPLIKKAFALYSGGQIGLRALASRMYEYGLRNRSGNKVTVSGLSTLLHNPFYVGLMRIEKTGELFVGRHRPILPKALFDRVQKALEGKNIKKSERHFFVYRRNINCRKCGNILIPEKQKIYIYYRCQTRNCTRGAIREDSIDREVLRTLGKLIMNAAEYRFFKAAALSETNHWRVECKVKTKQMHLQLEQIKDRLSKLADAYVDGVFEKGTYVQKKNALLMEERAVIEGLSELDRGPRASAKRIDEFLELVHSAYLSFKIGNPQERRDLIQIMTSNFSAAGKSVLVKLEYPFELMAKRPSVASGGPHRDTTRTFVKKLLDYFAHLDTSKSGDKLSEFLTSKTGKRSTNNFPARHY